MDAYARYWIHTTSDLSFNPYQHINSNGSWSSDEGFTQSMMDYCRQSLGSRCLLENNSIRTPTSMGAMYSYMQSKGPGICFQTAVMTRIGDLFQTLQEGIGYGANSMEVPVGYMNYPAANFAQYQQELKANPLPSQG